MPLKYLVPLKYLIYFLAGINTNSRAAKKKKCYHTARDEERRKFGHEDTLTFAVLGFARQQGYK